jgi:mannitol/fructose-specific phosphotransferase system IIA component (Ntr-type)
VIGRAAPTRRVIEGRDKPKQRKLGPLEPMAFVRFLKPSLYFPDLTADCKEELIEELLAGLSKERPEIECACIRDLLLARERLGTTALGKGLAVPHVRTALVTTLTVVIGLSTEGINYAAPDKKQVHVFFLVLGPHEDPSNLYLSFLASVVKTFKTRGMKRRLLGASGFEQFVGILEDALSRE